MRKIEVKHFGIWSVLKSTFYLYFIPIVLMFLAFIVATLVGVTQQGATAFMSIPLFLLMIVLYTGLYAGITSLVTVCYNWLAGKFGGLVMTIEDVAVHTAMESEHQEEESQLN